MHQKQSACFSQKKNSEFNYLGLLINSQLSFKSHVIKVGHRVKFNLSNFRFIRNSMTTDAAKIYMHAMIMSHFTYCLTSFAQANKTMDRKSNTYHHCLILRKYKLLSWDNLIKYANLCLIFKILHNKAPPPLQQCITQRSNTNRTTRGSSRGDCVVPFRKSAFSHSAFSVTASQEWNSLPAHIREISSYRPFSGQLKIWLNGHQLCTH